MPRLIDPGSGDAITLAELVEALDTAAFDPHDEDSFAALGPLLARLGRNQHFLADLAIEELKARCVHQSATNAYGPQVFMLRPPNGRFVVRANFWPARADPVVRASGTGPFFYDMPHDHNFPFLTYGYLGPGYWSDYFVYDGARFRGAPGDAVRLQFVERARLDPGKLMLYRMQRDIHVQLPPDSFSVSLNIMGQHPSHPWIDQYRFDIARGVIAEGLTMAPAEALATLAVHLGGEDGRGIVAELAVSHPHPRMRATALAACRSGGDPDAVARLLLRAADDPDEAIRRTVRGQLARPDRHCSISDLSPADSP
jgi:hypothetical protein